MTQVSLCRETAVWPWEQAGGRLTIPTSTYAVAANLQKYMVHVNKKKVMSFLGLCMLHLSCQMQRKQQDVACFLSVLAETWTTCDITD